MFLCAPKSTCQSIRRPVKLVSTGAGGAVGERGYPRHETLGAPAGYAVPRLPGWGRRRGWPKRSSSAHRVRDNFLYFLADELQPQAGPQGSRWSRDGQSPAMIRISSDLLSAVRLLQNALNCNKGLHLNRGVNRYSLEGKSCIFQFTRHGLVWIRGARHVEGACVPRER